MEAYIRSKSEQIEDPSVVDFYREIDGMLDGRLGDPRLPALADRLVAQLAEVDEAEWRSFADDGIPPDLADLLDSMFVDQVPVARELMRLVEDRGWTGWTVLSRVEGPTAAR